MVDTNIALEALGALCGATVISEQQRHRRVDVAGGKLQLVGRQRQLDTTDLIQNVADQTR